MMIRAARAKLGIMMVVLAWGWPVWPGPVHAQETFEFSNSREDQAQVAGIPVRGRFSLESARQLKGPGRWIRLGPSLDLIYDQTTRTGQFYFEGTGRYNLSYRIEGDSEKTRDTYEFEFLPRELYWKKSVGCFTFSAGKIIDDPSVMDLVQVVDKVSVINRAEAFFAEPEEVKQGQNLVKVNYYSPGLFEAGVLLIPYPLFDRMTDLGHPYALVQDQQINSTRHRYDPEWQLQVSQRFQKSAVFSYIGRFNNRSPILESRSVSGAARLYKTYAPYWSAGTALSLAAEPFLLKSEIVYNWEKPLQRNANGRTAGFARHDQLEIAAGMEVNLGNRGMLTMEWTAASPLKRDENLAFDRTAWTGAVSWSNSYMSDKIDLTLTTLFIESFKNTINRIQVTYAFTDFLSMDINLTFAGIRRKTDDYGFMKNYDRVDLSLNYDFSLE